jgi:hypothetical protein
MAEEQAERRRQGSRRSVSRVERRRRSQRRKGRRTLLLSVGVGLIAIVLVVGLFLPQIISFGGGSSGTAGNNQDTAPPSGDQDAVLPSGDQVGTFFPSLGDDHIAPGSRHTYNSTPPTSGPHYPSAAAWGVYTVQIQNETIVHNLEHGGIVISYNLQDEEQMAALREFVEGQPGYPGCFVMHPYSDIDPGSIVLTSWQWLQQIEGADTEGMQAFVDAHRNSGPEHLGPNCGSDS